MYVGRLLQTENRKWAELTGLRNNKWKRMNSSEVKEEFRDKTGKRKMFMLGCSKKGHFNVPLRVGGMWRLGCVG